MSDQPADLTLVRFGRLNEAVADLVDGNTRQFRALSTLLVGLDARFDRLDARLDAIDATLRSVRSEKPLSAIRVEEAFSRALRASIRLDDAEAALP